MKELLGDAPDLSLYLESVIHKAPTLPRLDQTSDAEFFLRAVWGPLGIDTFRDAIGASKVFRLNPAACREPGAPTPNPELDAYGRNLPVMVDHFKSKLPQQYQLVLETLRGVMPSLVDLEVDYTHTKTLALFLKERGFGRAWPAEDVSDGTLHALSLLLAIFDPRTSLIVIEEPENSVHPWAIRNLINAARVAAEHKQIILTTHSPILIDQLKPEEVWIVRRPGAETLIDRVLDLDPSVAEGWGNGHFTLAEYLDSGAIPDAAPTE